MVMLVIFQEKTFINFTNGKRLSIRKSRYREN